MTGTIAGEGAGVHDTEETGDTARVQLNITFPSGARIGPGKATLLEGIRDTGSISAAARALGMDYTRAWMLLDSLDRAFDVPVVERKTGGPGGGGAALTEFGMDLLDRYRRIEAGAEALAREDLVALQRHALPNAGPKV
jgi:molybdate transport system regulatory protein